jgi:hypothetical protein
VVVLLVRVVTIALTTAFQDVLVLAQEILDTFTFRSISLVLVFLVSRSSTAKSVKLTL